ncbi:GAF domain-containing SpoIIE family protein phosphatase [Cellulomonas pakistanensis]|uniref:GAF domain-containing SpoIIE family protein phosphatase n=1 Tax=Cellulomonas pakistanensis TaxID=992287 RepID=UPI001940C21A|nr:GAF domain-containing SpoIIE family protein phosphatase [Cellulomonas pakistanensis]
MATTDLPLPTVPCPGADPELERFGRLAAGHLGAPVALVSVLTDTEQLILGAVGLPPDLEAARRLPLTHALCLEVVRREEAVVVPDARDDPALAAHGAVTDLDVVAYVGCPLRDDEGKVVGALCAIDTAARAWTDEQVAYLADLAAACTSELRLRGERERARRTQRVATEAHRHGRLLLTMAEAFTAATTVAEVTRAVSRVAAIGLGATMSGVALLDADGHGLTYTSMDAFDGHGVEALRHAALTDDRPVAHVARTRVPLYFRDHTALVRRFPGMAGIDAGRDRPLPDGGRAVLPLVSRGRLLGVLTLGWPVPRDFRQENREVKAALAGYTAQALERALLLDQRRDVARTLQDAMLTALPQPDRFRLAASYLPAAQEDQVGGDWYDGLVLPDGDLVAVVGDVTGHDMDAAARMGQLRSTLRAFAWDRPDGAPSSWLARLDRADAGLGMGTVASALVARCAPLGTAADGTPGGTPGGVRVTWSNAGHPAPVLVRPGAGGRLLDPGSDLLLGVDPARDRRDHATDLRPGDTLLLYTDGLVERRDVALPHALERLAREAGRLADREPDRLVRELTAALVDGRPADDVAVLAVRVQAPDRR